MSETPRTIGSDNLRAAEDLSLEILGETESAAASLESAALKAARLADILGDPIAARAFRLEVSGYSRAAPGLPPAEWEAAGWSGRVQVIRDPNTRQDRRSATTTSIGELEASARNAEAILSAPQQTWNTIERNNLSTAKHMLGRARALIHSYASRVHNALRFSGIGRDVFDRVRAKVDQRIRDRIPDAAVKFLSVHDRLQSTNPEDWSGAVHSCRRILQDLADAVFPATGATRTATSGGKAVEVKLGTEQYINRLIAYVEDHTTSKRFRSVVGDHLDFLGNRLDSIYEATNKGTHGNVSKDEAERYVVLTYLLIGDLLSLEPDAPGTAG